jgi:hypothetical protein
MARKQSKQPVKSATKASATKTVRPPPPPVPVDSTSIKYKELVSLSEAFVKEIDNIMLSNLKPDHLGQVLGSVVKSYTEQLRVLS